MCMAQQYSMKRRIWDPNVVSGVTTQQIGGVIRLVVLQKDVVSFSVMNMLPILNQIKSFSIAASNAKVNSRAAVLYFEH